MTSVLVTGASGIAGAHVVDALRHAGIEAIPVSREARDGWATADLRDARAVRALPAYDAIVHCAALTPRSGERGAAAYREANVTSTIVLAEEASRRGVRRFVYVSTMGRPEQQDDAPGRHYIDSKRAAEERLRAIAGGRVPVWILRAASLYGEYDRGSMARLIGAVARGRFIALGSLRHRKCLLYAGSLGRLIATELLADTHEDRSESAHDGEVHRFAEVLATVEAAVGRRAPRVPSPDAATRASLRAARWAAELVGAHKVAGLFSGAAVALRDVPCEEPNAALRLGERVDLATGVRREVAWLRANGRL